MKNSTTVKQFKSKPVQSEEEYLQVVKRAERFIVQNMRESSDGLYWIDPNSGETDMTFYSGCAGIVYFYLQLNKVCPDKQYEGFILRGTQYLLAHLNDFDDSKVIYDYALPKMTKNGLYFGLGGIGLMFLEVYRSFHDPNAEKGAKAVTAYYLAKAKTDGKGTRWTVSPAIAMEGGIILYLLDFYRTFPDEQLKALLLSAGEHYLRMGKTRKSGTKEYNGYGGFLPYETPNWEFGNGGSGYLLTKLYDFSGDERYLQAAIDAAKHLLEVRVPQKAGYLIPHNITPFRKPTLFYAGLCHGPVGTSRLFYRLYQLTGDKFWYKQINCLVEGLESIGAPEIQTPGLWNNISYCCGHGGFIHFFLSLYCVDPKAHWRDWAIRSANILIGEMDDSDRQIAKWQIAWLRVKEDRLTTPIGFFDGAAGIAAALLELYLAETNRFTWSRLIDDPFPEMMEAAWK